MSSNKNLRNCLVLTDKSNQNLSHTENNSVKNRRNCAVLRDKSSNVLNVVKTTALKSTKSKNLISESNILPGSKKAVKTSLKKRKDVEEHISKTKTRSQTKENEFRDYIHPDLQKIKKISNGELCVHNDKADNKIILSKCKQSVKSSLTSYYPIWKKQVPGLPASSLKKRNAIDIYDISKDEDFMHSEETGVKKRKAKPSKYSKNKARGNGKKAQSNKFMTNSNVKHQITQNKIILNMVSSTATERNENAIQVVPETEPQYDNNLEGTNEEIFQSHKNTDLCEEVTVSILNEKENNFDQLNDIPEPLCDSIAQSVENDSNVPVSSGTMIELCKSKKKEFLNYLVEELEKSFLLPKMTSTPENSILCGTAKVPKISLIPHSCVGTNKDWTPKMSPVKNKKSPGDINLFESPVKEEKKVKNKPFQKQNHPTLLSFFDELPVKNTLNNDDLGESVLQPNKTYCSPDNFKIRVARTERTAAVEKRKIKSKTDEFAKKMAQHFDEIDNTELYIE